MAYTIRLKDKKQRNLILVGSLRKGGLITTAQRHWDRLLALAYLTGDGKIVRLQKQIGTRNDIMITRRVKVPQRRATLADGVCEAMVSLDAMCGDLPDDIPEIR